MVSARSARQLEDLGVEPEVRDLAGPPAIRQAFDLLRLWHHARQAGLLVDIRRGQVTDSIFNAMFKEYRRGELDKSRTGLRGTAFVPRFS